MDLNSVHSTIEAALKHKEIYVPYECVKVIQISRKRCHILQKSLHDAVVTEMCVLKYENGKIEYKFDFDEEFKELPRRPKMFENLLKIQKTKYKHVNAIKELFHRPTGTSMMSFPIIIISAR